MRDRPSDMKRISVVALLLGTVLLSACGSESTSTVSTVAREPDPSVATDGSSPDSVPEDSFPDDSATDSSSAPATFDLPVADLPECVISPTLAIDSTGRPYQISEPSCAGGWMFAYSTECEYECESSLGIQMVDGQWQLRGWIYNMCYEGATGSFGLPEAVAIWHIRWSCEGDSPDDVYRPVAEASTGSLSLGDFGPRVSALDEALSASGFLVAAPNDAFDYDTLKAVLDLQFQLGLDIDGYAGPMTLGSLGLS
jgi:hypothetical protein